MSWLSTIPKRCAAWAGTLLLSTAALALAGCHTLPAINPDMAPPGKTVRIDGAHGPLSAAPFCFSKKLGSKPHMPGQLTF